MNAKCRRFHARSGNERSQEFWFRSHNANFGICDLYALRQCPQVIPPIAAAFKSQSVAGHAGEGADHIHCNRLIAGVVERSLGTLSVGLGLISNRLEAGHALFQH
ncbi:hypothetical protein [Nitrobacter sp.]|uniref:hypothetical protein n=1 Tax=Nitrobacter sp. TaxID=29420 RepID=UPI00399D66FB